MKKALLTMGLPAAGKSTTIDRHYKVNGWVVVDPDEIKKEQPSYDPKKPEVFHEWSKAVAKARTAAAVEAGQNLIIDGTGTNVEKMYKQIKELQKAGYHVELLYVRVSLETSLRRNAARERVVPQHVIMEKFETITEAYEILNSVVNKATIIDNE